MLALPISDEHDPELHVLMNYNMYELVMCYYSPKTSMFRIVNTKSQIGLEIF